MERNIAQAFPKGKSLFCRTLPFYAIELWRKLCGGPSAICAAPLRFSLMDLTKNWRLVEERIQRACERADRDRAGVSLVAVSKGHPPDALRAAADLGQLLFGESKVQ